MISKVSELVCNYRRYLVSKSNSIIEKDPYYAKEAKKYYKMVRSSLNRQNIAINWERRDKERADVANLLVKRIHVLEKQLGCSIPSYEGAERRSFINSLAKRVPESDNKQIHQLARITNYLA